MHQARGIGPDTGQFPPSQPRDDPACISPWISFDEEGACRLQDEGASGALNHPAAEEDPEPLSSPATGQGMGDPSGEEAAPSGLPPSPVQVRTDLEEDLIRIWTPDHQPDEVLDLVLRDPATLPGILPVPTNLRLYHVGEPQPTGKGDGHILIVQNFLRQILVLESLEQGQRHLGMHSSS